MDLLFCVGKYLLLVKFSISDSENSTGYRKNLNKVHTWDLYSMLLQILMASCFTVQAYTKEYLMDCGGGGLVHLFALP